MSFPVWPRTLMGGWRHRQRLEELGEAVGTHLNVLPVVSAQLRDMNRQVEQAVAQVGGNFERMVEGAREGANQASRLVGAGGTSADNLAMGVGALLASSRTTLEDLLNRILGDNEVCQKLVERMNAVERNMGQIVRALAEVDRISFGNTIVALNAKIEAARLGERGRGFELVAQELWMQSQKSDHLTEEVRQTILRLAGDAKAAVTEIGGMACADHARMAALQAQVHQALDRLSSAHQETERTLAEGEARNEALAAEISAAIQAMQFQDRVSQQITHVAEALESMQAAIAAPLGAGNDPLGKPAAENLLSTSYTMDRERDVHAAALGAERVAGQDLESVEIF